MIVTLPRMNLDQFLSLPEEEPALEFFDGVVAQKLSPNGKHGRLQLYLASFLEQSAEQGNVGLAFTELHTTFAGASRVPDIAVYRSARVLIDATDEVADDVLEPPDIAVEIASPSQSVNEAVYKHRFHR